MSTAAIQASRPACGNCFPFARADGHEFTPPRSLCARPPFSNRAPERTRATSEAEDDVLVHSGEARVGVAIGHERSEVIAELERSDGGLIGAGHHLGPR
jgi:hypothetical protein